MHCLRFFALLLVFYVPSLSIGAEAWKGEPSEDEFTFAMMSGLGILDGDVGFALSGAIGKKIAHDGLLEDINDQVFLEMEIGPVFISGGTGAFFAFHARWDFQKDDKFGLFGLAGVGGFLSGASLGSRNRFSPRFGIGAIYRLASEISARVQITHNLIATGFQLHF